MTYSPLCDRIQPPTGLYWDAQNGRWINKWTPRPIDVEINGVIAHHHGTTSLAGYDRLITSTDGASANYLIMNDGEIIGSVDEDLRAWTSGSYAADGDKITIEIQNETGVPEWRISNAAMTSFIALYEDIARRRGFPPDKTHLHGHRDYAATECPGPYLYPRLEYVARTATQLGEEPMTRESEEKHHSRVRWIMKAIGGSNKGDSIRKRLARIERKIDTLIAIVKGNG